MFTGGHMSAVIESDTRYPGIPQSVSQRQRQYLDRRASAIDNALRKIRSSVTEEDRRSAIATVWFLGYSEGLTDGGL